MPSFSEPTVNPTRSGDAIHVLQKFLLNLPVENEGGVLGWMSASSPLEWGFRKRVPEELIQPCVTLFGGII